MTKCFYYFIHYQLKIQLFIISFNKNFHTCQTMLDTSNKRYKIEVSGRGKGINDNSEGALIEGYIKWLEDEFLPSSENGLKGEGVQESFLEKIEE